MDGNLRKSRLKILRLVGVQPLGCPRVDKPGMKEYVNAQDTSGGSLRIAGETR